MDAAQEEWRKVQSMKKVIEMDDEWYYNFAEAFPEHVRKHRTARNSPMILRRSAVAAAVDAGWGMENNGRRVAQ